MQQRDEGLAVNDRATVLGSTLSASGATVLGSTLSASGATVLGSTLSASGATRRSSV
jgi:hypothetical protein